MTKLLLTKYWDAETLILSPRLATYSLRMIGQVT